MFCSHSSPVNEILLNVSNLETQSLEELSTILHVKDVSHELKRNSDNFGISLPLSNLHSNPIISDRPDFDESVKIKAEKANQMGRIKRKLQSVSVGRKETSSNKENLQIGKIKHNVNQRNSGIPIKPPVKINGNMCFNNQLHENCSGKLTNDSLQEFSIFNDFSPSVRVMLTELGLKPPPNKISEIECSSKISTFDLEREIPRPLPLQENKVLINKLEKVGCFVPSVLTSVNPGQEFRSSDYNQINHQIQGELEKERFRRKHYEHVIEDLQQKVLTMEQELALMSSINEKKNLTVKELIQTLENLAIAWQKLEGPQMKKLKETEIERENLRLQLETSIKQTNILQKELEETKEILSEQKMNLLKEQEKHEEVVKNLNNQKHDLEEEISTSKKSLQRELMFGEELKSEVLKLQKLLQEEQLSLLQKASDFDNFKHVIQNQLSAEAQKREEKETKLDEISFKLEAANAEIFSLKEQLDLEKKEKDTVKTELRQRESEFISDELKYRTEMECKVKEVQVRAEEQSKHLEETLNKKYKEEISHILSEHKQWKEEEEAKHLKEIQECRNEITKKFEESQEWVKSSETEALNLRHKIEQIERGRSQILSQLQSFLQLMWRNSFQLFYGTCDTDSELFQQKHQIEEYIPVSSAPAQVELHSIPTKKYFSMSLPLNLTSDIGINQEYGLEKGGAYDDSMRETKQFGNISFNNKHIGTSVILPKFDKKCLENKNLILHKEKVNYFDFMDQTVYEHRTKVLPVDSQMQNSFEEKYDILPEQMSSVGCCDKSTYYQQVKSNYNKSGDKVSSPQDTLCSISNSTKDTSTERYSTQKMKNSVHFMVPCKDSDESTRYSEEENKWLNDRCSQNSSTSTEMMQLPTLTKNSRHSPLMIQKICCHQMSAEKPEMHLKPLKKEIISVNPISVVQNNNPDKMEEHTMRNKTQTEPVVLQRKKYSGEKLEKVKENKLLQKELPSNYPNKDLHAIYCPEIRYGIDKSSSRTTIKDWELYNKSHPWK